MPKLKQKVSGGFRSETGVGASGPDILGVGGL